MKHLPVNWREGLFLQPQHFQAADRHWDEITRTAQSWDHPYHYGLQDISHSFEGVSLRVDRIHARMRDGTLICRQEDAPPLRVDLGKVLESEQSKRIYLCVPELKPGDVNIRPDGPETHPNSAAIVRYVTKKRHWSDENESGGDEREIELRDLDVRLLTELDDRAGYAELPIAQIRRPTASEVGPQLDERYIPPVLGINTWIQLGKGIVRGVHDALLQNVNVQTEALRDVNIRDHILEVSQSVRITWLDRLNEASAALGVMVPPVLGVHPFVAYAELCRILGQLSIFTHEKRVPKIPRYDHDDLWTVFHEVCDLILRILDIQFEDYLRKNFVWDGNLMVAELSPAWFDPRVEWFIGVDRGGKTSEFESPSDAECRRLLSRENGFLWKFGSMDSDLHTPRPVGLEVKEEHSINATLPPQQYWSYWRVKTEMSDPYYFKISKSQTIAAFIKDHKNPSFKPSDYVGTSRFPVIVSESNRDTIELKLALFGVRH